VSENVGAFLGEVHVGAGAILAQGLVVRARRRGEHR
jgi:hypothetical protein